MLGSLTGLPALALVFGIGACAQWLAWRLRVPAILLLLTAGFAVGPVSGVLDPGALFGDAFRPLVSFAGTGQFGAQQFAAQRADAVPMFVWTPEQQLQVFSVDHTPVLRPGCTVLSLVRGNGAAAT